MFRFISNFFNVFLAELRLTLREIGWSLGIIVVLTIIGILPAFCGTPVKHSFYLSFPIWLFSAYRIFGIWRYLRIALAGEVLDSFQAIGPETNQTIWDSELATTYRKVAINIWLGQTVIFLAAPLYFNLTSGGRLWLPVLIMVIFAIAMISAKAGLWLFRGVAMLTIAVFILIAGYDMFPQIGYIPFVSEGVAKLKAGKEAGENARKLAEIHALREKQRQEMVAGAAEKARVWQEENPGKVLPDVILQELEAARKGLSLGEYKDELNKIAEAQAEAERKAVAKAKADALEKNRQDAKRQEAEKKAKAEAVEKERRSVLVLKPATESSGPNRYFVLPPETKYGDRFEFLEAVPLVGEGGGSIFIGNSSVGSFPSVVPRGFTFTIPNEAIKKNGVFELLIFNSNPQNINEIKLKKGGG